MTGSSRDREDAWSGASLQVDHLRDALDREKPNDAVDTLLRRIKALSNSNSRLNGCRSLRGRGRIPAAGRER